MHDSSDIEPLNVVKIPQFRQRLQDDPFDRLRYPRGIERGIGRGSVIHLSTIANGVSAC